MEEPTVRSAPPPLPPKTRTKLPSGAADSPTSSVGATVIIPPLAPNVFSSHLSFPEVQGLHNSTHSQSTATTVHTTGGHVVKIKINPENGEVKSAPVSSIVQLNVQKDPKDSENLTELVDGVSVLTLGQTVVDGCIRINVGSNERDLNTDEMIQRNTGITESFIKTSAERSNPYFYYNSLPCVTSTMVMSSGQCSPSDTLDSGTCSDLDSTPPPLPKKKSSGVSVTVIGAQHKRASSLTSSGAEVDSDDNESNISCDSLNSSELNAANGEDNNKVLSKCPSPQISVLPIYSQDKDEASAFIPQGLLQDIKDRSAKLSQLIVSEVSQNNGEQLIVETALQQPTVVVEETCSVKDTVASGEMAKRQTLVGESTNKERKTVQKQRTYEINESDFIKSGSYTYEADKHYNFHVNEHIVKKSAKKVTVKSPQEEELFAGYKDIVGSNGRSNICSATGSVRGVRNRVRAGIATFLQINSTNKKYKEKEAGKVVVYTTAVGIVRGMYHNSLKVKLILHTHLVKFEERDVSRSVEFHAEIRDRMRCEQIKVPQVFVDGEHIGDIERIESLNETGELRRILQPYKSADACTTCLACGGYRLLLCPVCNGSKKSEHRNNFTAEFVALKCMNCDEFGLVRCGEC